MKWSSNVKTETIILAQSFDEQPLVSQHNIFLEQLESISKFIEFLSPKLNKIIRNIDICYQNYSIEAIP